MSRLLSEINNEKLYAERALRDGAGNEIATTYATATALSSKQDSISDLSTIRSGAAAGATALQTETDPVFTASAAHGISSADISNWNAKQDAIADLATIRSGAEAGASALQESDLTLDSEDKVTAIKGHGLAGGGSGDVDLFIAEFSEDDPSVDTSIEDVRAAYTAGKKLMVHFVSGAIECVLPMIGHKETTSVYEYHPEFLFGGFEDGPSASALSNLHARYVGLYANTPSGWRTCESDTLASASDVKTYSAGAGMALSSDNKFSLAATSSDGSISVENGDLKFTNKLTGGDQKILETVVQAYEQTLVFDSLLLSEGDRLCIKVPVWTSGMIYSGNVKLSGEQLASLSNIMFENSSGTEVEQVLYTVQLPGSYSLDSFNFAGVSSLDFYVKHQGTAVDAVYLKNSDITVVDDKVTAINGHELAGGGGTSFEVGDGLEMSTDPTTGAQVLHVSDPVDIVAGPGIVIDNPDGNSLRVSCEADAETVLWENSAGTVIGSFSASLSESATNFDRVRLYYAPWSLTSTGILCEEFTVSAAYREVSLCKSWLASNGTTPFLFCTQLLFDGSTVTVSSSASIALKTAAVTTTNNTGRFFKIVGIHRIAGGN